MTSLPRTIGIAAVAALFAATMFFHAGTRPVSAGVPASIVIDTDITNGTGPCDIIDATANISFNTTTVVAICLLNASASPVNGSISGASLGVSYTSPPLSAPDFFGNFTTDLNANPNWNETIGGQMTTTWDCNPLDIPGTAPNAVGGVATISCDSGLVDEAVTGTVLLATLTFDPATFLGTSTLAFTNTTDFSTGALGATNPVCDPQNIQPITCTGASITVQAAATATATSTATDTATAPATNTATNTATATPTSTPCATNGTPVTCPTATTTATTAANTHTPTPTSSAVATATNTKAAGASAPQSGGGAGAGGTSPIRLPNTGATRTNDTSGGISQYVWLAMALAAAAALGGGMLLTVRRKQ